MRKSKLLFYSCAIMAIQSAVAQTREVTGRVVSSPFIRNI
jgi:hypothetical protein